MMQCRCEANEKGKTQERSRSRNDELALRRPETLIGVCQDEWPVDP